MRLIPAIDLVAGRCVRLLHGDFAAQTAYAATPLELLKRYADAGADWLHVVDLDGARDGAAGNLAVIGELAAHQRVHLQVGGGLRDRAAVAAMLGRGAARAVVGSAAVTQAPSVLAWMAEFGAERIALAFDVRIDAAGIPCVATHGWQTQSTLPMWEALEPFAATVRHVLCTDVGRDGALTGPNLVLYAEAQRRHPEVAWQASGGIRDAPDLAALAAIGVAAAISGKALLEHRIPPAELRPFLPNA